MAPDRSWLVCSETISALERVESGLALAVQTQARFLHAVSSYLLSKDGKLLRPALALLAGRFSPRTEGERLERAAIAIELLHVASLYHDDVMDGASERRGAPSANVQWGNVVASLGGTYLFAHASTLVASLGPWANRIYSAAILQLCTGQLLELEHAYNLDLTEGEYLQIVAKKTATLFELPLRLGAFVAGASDEDVERLAAFGRHLGLAYQLADDALDLAGTESTMGKSTGRDLQRGVYTLPVLRACRRTPCGEKLRDILEAFDPSDVEIDAAANLICQSGAVEETLAFAKETARRAQAFLSQLADNAARTSLHDLAEATAARCS